MTKDQKKKKKPRWNHKENPDETQRLPHRNPHRFHSRSPSLISLSVCGLVLLHLPLLKTLSGIADFCLRRCNTWDRRTNAAQWLCERKREVGQWLSLMAARAVVVVGCCEGFCCRRQQLQLGLLLTAARAWNFRRRLGFDFFPLSLSLSLWVFTPGRK